MFFSLLPLIQMNCPQKRMIIAKAAILSLSVSVTIEIMQYLENIFAVSAIPVSDVILNSVGGIAGYGIFKLWRTFRNRRTDVGYKAIDRRK